MAINFNTEPYYDDYDEDDGFLRVLFRPGFPVQARELTQLQTILQNQVSRHGDHIFKDGAMVIPGQAGIDVELAYIKLQPEFNGVDITTYLDEFLNQEITSSSGINAKVIFISQPTATDPATLYVKYLNGGDDTVTQVFADNEAIQTVNAPTTRFATTASSNATGVGSSATIQRGVYYVNKFFTLVTEQTIILDKYTNTPSYRIGLEIDEQLITPEEENTLLDNAQGASNFAAPGAHRYQVTLTLAKRSLDAEDDENFIEVLRVENGGIQYKLNTTRYSELEKTLARRTFDESGNYAVRAFGIDVREHRDNFRGDWVVSTFYRYGDIVRNSNGDFYTATISGTSPSTELNEPVHTFGVATDGNIDWEFTANPRYNRGIYSVEDGGEEDKLAVGIEPGKAYVLGYEIERVATEFVEVPKARSFNRVVAGTINNTVGTYVLVDRVYGVPELSAFERVTLYSDARGSLSSSPNGIPVGTARARYFELHNGIYGSATAQYKMSLFDIQMYSGVTLIRVTNGGAGYGSTPTVSLTAAPAGGTNATASAIVSGGVVVAVVITNPGSGYVTAPTVSFSGGSPSTAATAVSTIGPFDFGRNVRGVFNNTGTIVFAADTVPTYTTLVGTATNGGTNTTVTGNGTKYTLQLNNNDVIRTSDNKTFRVGFIDSNTTLYSQQTPSAFTSQAIQVVSTTLYEAESNSLIYNFPYRFIRNTKYTDDTTLDSNYFIRQVFETTTDSSGNVVISTGADNQTFQSPDTPNNDENYLVAVKSSGAIVAPSSITLNSVLTTATIATALGSSVPVIVVATVKKVTSAAAPKTKTLVQNATYTTTVASSGAATAEVSATTITLAKADIYKIEKIEMSKIAIGDSGWDTFPTDAADIEDITNRYSLDDGQRDTHYDVGRIIRSAAGSAPTGIVRITFDYFSHSSGDYFTVDSYSGINYEDIPPYISPTSGKVFALQDVLDFRPRINDAGTTFSGVGSSSSNMPSRAYDFQTSYSYYLPRRDKIVLSYDGNLIDLQGIPEAEPKAPADLPDAMTLYNILLQPYTLDTTSANVIISPVDNRRYTMRDIGRLEKRIENLEEYTRLNALELATIQRQIRDIETDGTVDPNSPERLKLGFVVDSFIGHTVGDVDDPDYRCSIDMENNELRPFFYQDNVNLVEKNTTNSQRIASGYQITGDYITLPYTNEVLINQPYASRTENVNPFAIFTFIGQLDLNPPSDEWFEIDRRPDVVIEEEGNFDSIKRLAEAAGVLGTVWNNWQTTWTGTPQKTVTARVLRGFSTEQTSLVNNATGFWRSRSSFTSSDIAKFNIKPGDRIIRTERSVQEIGQTRSGVQTNIVEKIDRRTVNDRVLSTAVIPFIRSRPIMFKAQAMKAGVKLFAFFDNTDVTSYVTPATQITIGSVSGDFDVETSVGQNSAEAARTDAKGNAVAAYNKGDIIRGVTSGATALVVFQQQGPTASSNDVLHVVNVKGTFTNGEQIVGSVSRITANVISSRTPTTLVPNTDGEVAGVFNVPNTNALRFRTGTRVFKLSDDSRNRDSLAKTRAERSYTASGVIETRQATVVATRNAVIDTRTVTNNRTVTSTTDRVVGDTGWYDPLAQTFLVQQFGGAFITKIDLYFRTKDSSIPVKLQVRETVNGYPGKVILPNSEIILKPSRVNVSEDASVPTTFTFPAPIYLRDRGEYCFVLLSDSNQYNMWISQMGEKNIGTDRQISEQPYAGVLFKSQNASTWTAEQLQDMKFKIYRARFAAGTPGIVDFVNERLPVVELAQNAINMTSGSGVITIFQPNHGMPTNSRVTLAGFTNATSYNGILGSVLNGTHIVTQLDLDRYTISTSGVATETITLAVAGITATDNDMYDSIQVNSAEILFPDTTIDYSIRTTSGRSLHGTETPYIVESAFTPVQANDNFIFTEPRVMASSVNESSLMGGEKSFTFRATLYTENDALSPMLDMTRASSITVGNRVNNPTNANTSPFIEETQPNSGSVVSKYITRSINLVEAATGLRLIFDANVPPGSSIEVYHKTQPVGGSTPFELINWVPVSPIDPIIETADPNNFNEISYDIPSIPQFTSCAVKIAFKSTNSSRIPRVRDFRVIILA